MLYNNRLEQRLAAMRERQKEVKRQATAAYALEREQEQREKGAFKKISWYLYAQKRALAKERRVTAFHGCRTSWPRIEAHAIYAVVAEGQSSAVIRSRRNRSRCLA